MQRDNIKWLFWLSFVLALASLASLGQIDTHLKTEASPLGIVSFELCAYTQSCNAIVASWKGDAQAMAGLSLGLDYLFMLTYPAAIFLGLHLTAAHVPSWLKNATLTAAYISWLAGVADAVENYHLFQILIGAQEVSHAWPASVAATIKFAVLIPTLSLLLFNCVIFRTRTRTNSTSASTKA
jgi:hypothetical protein